MGCGYDIACRHCKLSFYVGYGSYGTWYSGKLLLAPVQDWLASHPHEATLLKNQNILKVVTEHAGHDLVWNSHDAMFEHDGVLKLDRGGYAPDDIIIDDYAAYERVDLYSREP